MSSNAQTLVAFVYDDCGNRTNRYISVLEEKSKKTADSTNTEESVPDLLVRIYPNPTKGILKVETSFAPEGSKIEVTIHNMQGELVYKNTISESYELDISDKPDGLYILRIRVSDTINTWKIVKNSE